MICLETALKVRRLCLVEGQSIAEVARRFQLSRNTVRKYLRHSAPPTYTQESWTLSPATMEH
ncbi:MAG: helix-turn-helix domain-containing protein [Proteobacteria bacterium]|nr:helix-turn-helix domain-containing protein [Pseudomonadota bacterium]